MFIPIIQISYQPFRRVVMLLIILATTGCISITWSGFEMYEQGTDVLKLNQAVVNDLFEAQDEFIYQDDGIQMFALYCTTSEGSGCFYVPATVLPEWDGAYQSGFMGQGHRLENEVNDYITDSIRKYAPGYLLNPGVGLRCQRSIANPDQIRCEVYNEDAWHPVTLE